MLRDRIKNFVPHTPQEAADQELVLYCLSRGDELLTRENPVCHFTASAWVVNPGRDKVLMAYHNIYHSWSWLGGHADEIGRAHV